LPQPVFEYVSLTIACGNRFPAPVRSFDVTIRVRWCKRDWLAGFDSKGRPQRVPGKVATEEGTRIMPTVLGATNWYPPSYSPRTGLFYIPGWENAGTINYLGKRSRDSGLTPMADVKLLPNLRTDAEGYGVVRAFDPTTVKGSGSTK